MLMCLYCVCIASLTANVLGLDTKTEPPPPKAPLSASHLSPPISPVDPSARATAVSPQQRTHTRSSSSSSSFTSGVLIVHVQSGSQLMAFDVGGKSDPYVQLAVGNKTVRTKTVPNSLVSRCLSVDALCVAGCLTQVCVGTGPGVGRAVRL
jgi:hypothetical protein